jgi:acetolactate synthase-1/2/3 large subunit
MGDGGFGISGFDMDTLVRYNLPAVVVVMNNNNWASVAAGHDAFYPDMAPWDNLPGLRYDRIFTEFGCHGEYVTTPHELVPALTRAFESGKAAVVNVVADTTDIHPLRQRVSIGDTWSRQNAAQLPQAGKDILRRAVAAESSLARIRKYWIDNGVDIPESELRALAQEAGDGAE